MKLATFAKVNYLFLWVVNGTEDKVKALLDDQGLQYRDKITWVKLSTGGKILGATGHYALHAKAHLHLYTPKSKGHEVERTCLPNVMADLRRRQSHKPASLMQLIDELQPGEVKLEFYARHSNLRMGWTSVGLDVLHPYLPDIRN